MLGATAFELPSLLLVVLPPPELEDGAVAKLLPLPVLAVGPDAELVGVSSDGVGALLEALGLDEEGAAAGAVTPPPVAGVRGTTEALPGVVPGEDGGTGTSLCMHRQQSYEI